MWGTVFFGGLACIGLIRLFPAGIGETTTLLFACTLFLLIYFCVGFLMNGLGVFLVNRLIAEATAWEMAGGVTAAKETYVKAVALFDSFLMSPLGGRKKTSLLLSKLARFQLARAEQNRELEIFVTYYLKTHPDDKEAAESWLLQTIGQKEIRKEYHLLAAAVGEAQAENLTIQKLLARFYLHSRRSDFHALQTYRRVLERDHKDDNSIAGDLAALFLDQRRIDEWALQIYLKALDKKEEDGHLLQGITACVQRIQQTEENRHMLQTARQYLEGLDEQTIEQMTNEFDPLITVPAEIRRDRMIGALRDSIGRFVEVINTLVQETTRRGWHRTRMFIQLVQGGARFKRISRWVFVSILMVVIGMFILNTVNHLIKTRVRITRISEPVTMAVNNQKTDRFTIQVAAYLNSGHAERYVVELKKKNIDAFWTEAAGAEQKWYQVRISHFPDIGSARQYGEKLKSFGIIDDFYVANYEHHLN